MPCPGHPAVIVIYIAAPAIHRRARPAASSALLSFGCILLFATSNDRLIEGSDIVGLADVGAKRPDWRLDNVTSSDCPLHPFW